jgi:hypothetical protein
VVARTSENASTVTEGPINLNPFKAKWQPKPPLEQYAIAAVADGPLKSAFGDKQAPAPSRVLVISSSEFITNPFAYAGNGPELGGQFAMMGNVGGDRQLLAIAGPYAQRYLSYMVLAVRNTLDWISGDTDLLSVTAKIVGDPNLTYASITPPEPSVEDDEAALTKKEEEYKQARKSLEKQINWLLTLGLPLLIAALGFLRWRMRQTRKHQYSLA